MGERHILGNGVAYTKWHPTGKLRCRLIFTNSLSDSFCTFHLNTRRLHCWENQTKTRGNQQVEHGNKLLCCGFFSHQVSKISMHCNLYGGIEVVGLVKCRVEFVLSVLDSILNLFHGVTDVLHVLLQLHSPWYPTHLKQTCDHEGLVSIQRCGVFFFQKQNTLEDSIRNTQLNLRELFKP